tara:strand:- start:1245 stop:1631 length:387 start_codon:yes stop_codon:yes gene_type:complete
MATYGRNTRRTTRNRRSVNRNRSMMNRTNNRRNTVNRPMGRNTTRNRRSLLSRGAVGRAFRTRSRNSVLRRANAIRNRSRGRNVRNFTNSNGNGGLVNRSNALINSFDDVRMTKRPTGNVYRKVRRKI